MKSCGKMVDMTVYMIHYTHTHTRLTALFPGLPGWAGTRKVKPIWILLEQETVSGSGIWFTTIAKMAICYVLQLHLHLTFCVLDILTCHWQISMWHPLSYVICKLIYWWMSWRSRWISPQSARWWHDARRCHWWPGWCHTAFLCTIQCVGCRRNSQLTWSH